eukprot:290772-Chlamydomonas_euryale.AAC.1
MHHVHPGSGRQPCAALLHALHFCLGVWSCPRVEASPCCAALALGPSATHMQEINMAALFLSGGVSSVS